MIITAHAVSRYRERVEPVDFDTACARLSTDRIRTAITFGARMIRLGGGQRLIIKDGAIVTVTSADRVSRNWLDRTSKGQE